MVVYLGKATPASGQGGGGSGEAVWGEITGTLADQTDLADALSAKQDTLVSGTNIKTVNNETLLGSGNLNIDSLPSQSGNSGKFLTTDGTDASWANVSASVPNKNTAVGATNPLNFWEGTESQWNTGGGSQTWYNWLYTTSGELVAGTIPSSRYTGIAYGNNIYVARGDYAAYSSDGHTWTANTSVEGSAKIIYANNLFVTVGEYSSDGLTWTASTKPNGRFYSIAYGNGIFVGTAKIGKAYMGIYSTDNGQTWTATSNEMPNGLYYCVAYGNNKFVALGNSICAYSTDGQTWNECNTPPTGGYYYGLVYANNLFVAVGANNIFAYSSDGLTWTTGIIPNSSCNYQAITYGNGLLVAIGMNSCAYSTDGQNWALAIIPTGNYYDITYGDGEFVAVGTDVCAYGSLSGGTSLLVFTDNDTPTTESTVYSAPNTTSALTITAVGTGTITLSDTNTYDYNASGNQTVSQTVGQAHPDWICMIEGVGIKKGSTTIASIAPTVDQTYDATSVNAQSGVAVASGISDTLGTIETALQGV